MVDTDTIRTLLAHSDWANQQIVEACIGLDDKQLDAPFEMGRGSLRRTLLHLLAGESVWLSRWQGRTETPWPDEDEHVGPRTVGERFRSTIAERERFLETVEPGSLDRLVAYRDSKGSLFEAALGDMMLQVCLHSAHHRAQAVNMLRRLGVEPPELDYMMRVRRPV